MEGPRVYIGGPIPGKLIVYNHAIQHRWTVSLASVTEFGFQLPSTSQLTLSGSTLYMTSERLYKLDLSLFRLIHNLTTVSTVTYIYTFIFTLLQNIANKCLYELCFLLKKTTKIYSEILLLRLKIAFQEKMIIFNDSITGAA